MSEAAQALRLFETGGQAVPAGRGSSAAAGEGSQGDEFASLIAPEGARDGAPTTATPRASAKSGAGAGGAGQSGTAASATLNLVPTPGEAAADGTTAATVDGEETETSAAPVPETATAATNASAGTSTQASPRGDAVDQTTERTDQGPRPDGRTAAPEAELPAATALSGDETPSGTAIAGSADGNTAPETADTTIPAPSAATDADGETDPDARPQDTALAAAGPGTAPAPGETPAARSNNATASAAAPATAPGDTPPAPPAPQPAREPLRAGAPSTAATSPGAAGSNPAVQAAGGDAANGQSNAGTDGDGDGDAQRPNAATSRQASGNAAGTEIFRPTVRTAGNELGERPGSTPALSQTTAEQPVFASPQGTAQPVVRAALQPGGGVQLPVRTLAVHIAQRVADGSNEFRIRLDPPELGRIDVRMEIARDGQLTAQLTADRPETLEALQRDARALERALQTAGLDVEDGALNFELREDAARDDDAGRAEDDGDGEGDGEDGEDAAATHRRISLNGLDIRV